MKILDVNFYSVSLIFAPARAKMPGSVFFETVGIRFDAIKTVTETGQVM